jgi:hypothetical protein
MMFVSGALWVSLEDHSKLRRLQQDTVVLVKHRENQEDENLSTSINQNEKRRTSKVDDQIVMSPKPTLTIHKHWHNGKIPP